MESLTKRPEQHDNDGGSYESTAESELTSGEKLTTEQIFSVIASWITIASVAGLVWLLGHPLGEAYQISQVIGGVGTVLLSALGAFAALWWFFRREPLKPRLNIDQEVVIVPVFGTSNGHLLQVFARLHNVGDIPLRITEWRLWVCPLDPVPVEVLATLMKKSACVDRELDWVRCAGNRIEPECFDEIRMGTGEVQEIIASVFVPEGNRTVRVHSFFPHSALNRQGEDRGWTRYNIVQLKGAHDGEAAEGEQKRLGGEP